MMEINVRHYISWSTGIDTALLLQQVSCNLNGAKNWGEGVVSEQTILWVPNELELTYNGCFPLIEREDWAL